jgi:PIN domain nuclease of toxin-antitoxin system
MRLLLDSHAILWYVDQDHLLSRTAHAAITDPANDLLISAASIWEIAVKAGLGKLNLSLPYRDWMNKAIADLRAQLLSITVDYADRQASLPHHHRDPFDRMLAAQSLAENISLVSGDAVFDAYGVARIW